MVTSQLLARRVATRWLVVIALLTAVPALGGPGDRVDRFPIQLTNVIGRFDNEPQLAMDETGRFVAAWASDDSGTSAIHFRRFAADATPLGDEVSVATEQQSNHRLMEPRVAMAGDGSFVVIWFVEDVITAEGELYARRYAANDAALSDAVVVTDPLSRPVAFHGVATAGDGRFVVVWPGNDRPNGDGLPRPAFARLFDAAAVPQGPPFVVSTSQPGLKDVAWPQVAMSSAADFVVTWETETVDSTLTNVLLGRRFDANGSPIGDTFSVAAESPTTGLPSGHEIAMSATGQFVVVYTRGALPEEPFLVSTGVYGRRFDAAAEPLGGEFRVSSVGNARFRGRVALDLNAAGDFAVTWRETEEAGQLQSYLHTRLYRASGSPVTSDQRFGLSELASSSSSSWSGDSVAIDGAGNFVAAFYAFGTRPNGVSTRFAYAQRFAGYNDTRPACARYIATIVGTDGANTLHGGPGHDVINAGAGDDTIYAWAERDVTCGGPGNDVIYAGSGNDHLVGGAGDDLLDGGSGSDFCNGETHTNADTAVSCEDRRNIP